MWAKYRAVIAGSGSAAFAEPSVCDLVLRMVRKGRSESKTLAADSPSPIRVAYLGTATYDSDAARLAQTQQLQSRGCDIVSINVTWPSETKPIQELREAILSCDVVLVSGGNTLYALRRWKECGVDGVLREAADAGKLLAGGSAGAICWFDGGHSDSADPATFRPPRSSSDSSSSPSTSAETAPPVTSDWKYIRVSALGFFPGLLCPHHDRTQSNGTPRYIDFDAMLALHPGERGIGIDHWCALAIDEGSYELFSVPDKPGSVVFKEEEGGEARAVLAVDGSGVPGVWIKEMVPTSDDGDDDKKGLLKVLATAAPRVGRLDKLLRAATIIACETDVEDLVMRRNPTAES